MGCLFALMAGLFPRLALFILWVADHNTAARFLYERVGFRPTGER